MSWTDKNSFETRPVSREIAFSWSISSSWLLAKFHFDKILGGKLGFARVFFSDWHFEHNNQTQVIHTSGMRTVLTVGYAMLEFYAMSIIGGCSQGLAFGLELAQENGNFCPRHTFAKWAHAPWRRWCFGGDMPAVVISGPYTHGHRGDHFHASWQLFLHSCPVHRARQRWGSALSIYGGCYRRCRQGIVVKKMSKTLRLQWCRKQNIFSNR